MVASQWGLLRSSCLPCLPDDILFFRNRHRYDYTILREEEDLPMKLELQRRQHQDDLRGRLNIYANIFSITVIKAIDHSMHFYGFSCTPLPISL